MIWAFCTDSSHYFVICRGLCIRTYHERKDHGLPTWQLFFRTHSDSGEYGSSGYDYVGRPGKPPDLDALWPRFARPSVWKKADRYQPWDDAPWEIHRIEDGAAREAAYRAYVAESGATSSENLKRRLMFGLRLVMVTPTLVQEIL